MYSHPPVPFLLRIYHIRGPHLINPVIFSYSGVGIGCAQLHQSRSASRDLSGGLNISVKFQCSITHLSSLHRPRYMPKQPGLSKSIQITYGSTRGKSHRKKTHLINRTLGQIQEERQTAASDIAGKSLWLLRYNLLMIFILSAVLSFTQRQQILFADQLQPQEHVNVEDVPMQVDVDGGSDDDWEDEERVGLMSFPPGEEGFLQSHAGGESALHDILNGMSNSFVFLLFFSQRTQLSCSVSESTRACGGIVSSNVWMHGSDRRLS